MKTSFCFLAVALCLLSRSEATDPVFPFVLPWDDASPGVTDFSSLLEAPAGKSGRVRAGEDGHFYTGERRIRFFGVNFTNAACFPTHSGAEKLAARLAKFGMNAVRLHFIDSEWGNGSIWKRDLPGELDPESLDRLGYFVAQLKAKGIYTNLNLLVGRRFKGGQGLAADIEQLDWKESHIPGFFHAPHLELQKVYARQLLTYHNPHTGFTFAQDPAVAFVEINNENGLIHSWLGGKVDGLPEVFREDLRKQWNAWLQARYGSTGMLKKAWGAKEEPLGAEMLRNAAFAAGMEDWNFERHGGAVAEAVPQEGGVVRIQVAKPGTEAWHVQLNQPRLKLVAGQSYSFRFRARSAKPQQIRVAVEQAHDPWRDVGLSSSFSLGPDWKEGNFVFAATGTDDNVRAGFSGLGEAGAVVEFGGLSLRPGGVFGLSAGERLEGGAMPLFANQQAGERTPEARRDWMRFLYATEERYWLGLQSFLKGELGVKGLIGGTIVGCAPANMMAKLDWVDTHAYWQHPRWPGKQWDQDDWFVENRPMINEPGGVLPGLAAKRVAGKPHACTEYNHPAPNTYASEMFPLLAAYAALQDWDAIYGYTYSHGHRDGWDQRKITGYFDLDQHPAKMATAGAAAALFLRADVRPAIQVVLGELNQERELDLLGKAQAWGLVDASNAGVPREAALLHRIVLATETVTRPEGALAPGGAKIQEKRFTSDTGELTWDLSEPKRGVVTLNAPRSKAAIGFVGGKRFPLGEFTVEPGPTAQDGFSVITLTAGAASPGRWLLTATGSVENTGMRWKNEEKSSVGREWGGAPTLVEGIPARIGLVNGQKLRVWALDERGQRRQPVPVEPGEGGVFFRIGPQWKTLWYELAYGE